MGDNAIDLDYVPPMLAEIGEFSEDTLGVGAFCDDWIFNLE